MGEKESSGKKGKEIEEIARVVGKAVAPKVETVSNTSSPEKSSKKVEKKGKKSVEVPKSKLQPLEISVEGKFETLAPRNEAIVHVIESSTKGELNRILHGKVPKDVQMINMMDRVAELMEGGGTPDDVKNFYMHNRSTVAGLEGELQVCGEILNLGDRYPSGEAAYQSVLAEGGTGTPRAATKPFYENYTFKASGEAEKNVTLARKSAGEEIVDSETARNIAKHFEDRLLKGDFAGDETEMQRMIADIRSKGNELRYGANEEHFSSIYLSKEELALLIQNPMLFFMMKLDFMERELHDPNAPLFKASMNRLQLAQELFGNENFDITRLHSNAEPGELKMLLNDVQKEMHSPMKSQVSEMVDSRITAMFTTHDLNTSTDAAKFAENMKNKGDRPYLFAQTSEGGLVGEFKGRLEANLRQVTPQGLRRREFVDTYHQTQAINLTINQFEEEYPLLHRQKIIDYLLYFQQPNADGTKELSQDIINYVDGMKHEIIKSIVRRSENAMRLEMRMPALMTRGIGAHEYMSIKGGSSDVMQKFTLESTDVVEEGAAGALLPREFKLRKFFKGDPNSIIERTLWNHAARFTANLDPMVKRETNAVVDQLLHDLNLPANGTELQKSLRTRAIERTYYMLKMDNKGRETEEIFNKMKHTLIEQALKKGLSEEDGKKALNNLKNPNFQQLLIDQANSMNSDGSFNELVKTEVGGNVLQMRLFRAYLFLDSLWRSDTYLKSLRTGLQFGGDRSVGTALHASGLAVHFGVFKDHETKKEAIQNLSRTIKKTIELRPQGVAEMLIDGEDRKFNTWAFDKKREEYAFPEDWIAVLDRRFIMTNQMIQRQDLPAIRYQDSKTFVDLAGKVGTPEYEAIKTKATLTAEAFKNLPLEKQDELNKKFASLLDVHHEHDEFEGAIKKLMKESPDVEEQMARDWVEWRLVQQFEAAQSIFTIQLQDVVIQPDEVNPPPGQEKSKGIKITPINDIKTYFEDMKGLHDEISKDEGDYVKQLGSIHYARQYLNIRWIDDNPQYLMENPEQFKDRYTQEYTLYAKANGTEVKPYTTLETREGMGPAAKHGRGVADLAKAMGSADSWMSLKGGFSNDDKEFDKLIIEWRDSMVGYQGWDPATEGIGEWYAAHTDNMQTIPGREKRHDSSVDREARGPIGKSEDLQMGAERWEKLSGVLGNLDDINPELDDKVKDVLRISTLHIGKLNTHISWSSMAEKFPPLKTFLGGKLYRFLNKNFDLGLFQYKMRNVGLYAAVLGLIYAGKMVEKGTEDSSGGGKSK
ncbi:MAG: hypothetical protein V1917_03145 [Candidatus Gottesmanbacteria bacterium]